LQHWPRAKHAEVTANAQINTKNAIIGFIKNLLKLGSMSGLKNALFQRRKPGVSIPSRTPG
jgi:hypothetical protein